MLRVAILEAVHRWRTEKESCLSGEKQAEEEEEESIYTVHHEEVTSTVWETPRVIPAWAVLLVIQFTEFYV